MSGDNKSILSAPKTANASLQYPFVRGIDELLPDGLQLCLSDAVEGNSSDNVLVVNDWWPYAANVSLVLMTMSFSHNSLFSLSSSQNRHSGWSSECVGWPSNPAPNHRWLIYWRPVWLETLRYRQAASPSGKPPL